MNRLYRAEKYSPDCSRSTFGEYFSDWDKPVARTDPNFAAGRDEWVIPSGKIPSGLYIAVRPEGIFLLGISQAPGPSEIFRDRLSA